MSTDPFAIFETPKGGPKSIPRSTDFPDDANHNADLLIPDFGGAPIQGQPSAKESDKKLQGESEILFDAELDLSDQDDEFGDFETAETENSQRRDVVSRSIDRSLVAQLPTEPSNVIDFDGSTDNFPPVGSSSSLSRPLEDALLDVSVTVSEKAIPNKNLSALYVEEQQSTEVEDTIEDEWEPFEDCQGVDNLDGDRPPSEPPVTASTQSPVSTNEPRPNNVPPPAILLGVLPQIFQQLNSEETQASTQRQKLIFQTYNVAAYLIAGRALRWKRDSILSQSMKIGPAAAGRKGGGMKLASIDKSENLKEEREAGEAVHIWQQLSHSFHRSLKQAGGQASPMHLSASMKVQTLKTASVIGSTHACALCGLKRDERLIGAASEIEDSFGEFWIEQWGHRDCRDFWNRYNHLLQSR